MIVINGLHNMKRMEHRTAKSNVVITRRGFNLIELVLVMTIIAVLLGVLLHTLDQIDLLNGAMTLRDWRSPW